MSLIANCLAAKLNKFFVQRERVDLFNPEIDVEIRRRRLELVFRRANKICCEVNVFVDFELGSFKICKLCS
jgi:hypothetical protein